MAVNKVKVWHETVVIPTYPIGEPEKNPMFLEKRVYQGSSGVVYPYPIIEKVFDEKHDKEWQAVYLENNFVKIMVLPELGGRIQMAYDKTKQRHFVYYNQVIKPALVGLTGPWISGGIEFNWPQHHRPTTFDPVDFKFEENADGSATIWCSELERMFRTKGMTGFTLYPDKSYLEINVKLFNKTSMPQTFLWWANPAVHVNDHYQSVFPPDVHAVFDHGKRDVSAFPIATGTYYKVNYSPGTDISRYNNIPVPTSYMAITSKYDFIGGYEHDSRGGLLHVANHHVSPGKKQWTWGNGEFGKAWDRNLTDNDGPYIELMCGVYTDNQPDFSWLAPHEEKQFVQYFMPYRDLGMIKNATKDALVNLEINDQKATISVYTTGIYPTCHISLFLLGEIIFEDHYDASPSHSYKKTIELPKNVRYENLNLSVNDRDGKQLVGWQPEGDNEKEIPDPAKAALPPTEIENNEQLYLTGLHLEQYRHATYSPLPYYQEALNRYPGDIRNNNALGLWFLRRGKFALAEQHFRQALETIVQRNPNPNDGEPYFNLGISLRYQYKDEDAYSTLYKSTWNAAWQNPGFFHLAQLDVKKGKLESALEHINLALSKNSYDHKSSHLKIALLRKLNRREEAISVAIKSIELDHFNFGALYEKYLLTEKTEDLNEFQHLIRNNIHNYIEYSLDYALAGLYEEAIELLNNGIKTSRSDFPMAWYYLAWYQHLNGATGQAKSLFFEAAEKRPDYCFPNQLESILALQLATELNPKDDRAFYYLGNFWYNALQYDDALTCWEKSAELNDRFPTVQRNLALVHFNKIDDPDKALASLQKAFALDDKDARIFMELDQLYKRLNWAPHDRLDNMEKHQHLVLQRDDLYLEQVTLCNSTARYEMAYGLLMARKFHPWEGGEGKVTGQYVLSLTELGKEAYLNGHFHQAIDYLQLATKYPESLGEGKLYGAQENDIDYWLGCAYEKIHDQKNSKMYWGKASVGISEPTAAMFYNDQPPDKIFYQGLAQRKLGNEEAANLRFNKLIEYGKNHLRDEIKIDYFAVSLPDLLIWDDDLNLRNQIHCKYMMALGLLGLNHWEAAHNMIREILQIEKSHQGAILHLKIKKILEL